MWEIETGRCEAIWKVDGVVYDIAWNPNPAIAIVAACVGNRIIIIDPAIATVSNADETEAVFTGSFDASVSLSEGRAKVEWVDEDLSSDSSSLQRNPSGVR